MLVKHLVETTQHLRARVDVRTAVGLPGDRGADHVHHAQHPRALALQLLDGGQHVVRLARLGDRDVQGVGVDDRVAVAELGNAGLGGNPGQLLDQLGADLARVVRGAAAEDLDPAHPARLAGVQVEAAQVHGGEPVVDPAAQDAVHGVGLLGDLLVHVRVVAAHVVRLGLPLHGGRRGRRGRTLRRVRTEVVGLERAISPSSSVTTWRVWATRAATSEATNISFRRCRGRPGAVAGDHDAVVEVGVQHGPRCASTWRSASRTPSRVRRARVRWVSRRGGAAGARPPRRRSTATLFHHCQGWTGSRK
ncbi:hypothetical protein SBADM41S_05693 [Streptomyces badius]